MFVSHLLCSLAAALIVYTMLVFKIDNLKAQLSNLQINYKYLENFINQVNDRLNLYKWAEEEKPVYRLEKDLPGNKNPPPPPPKPPYTPDKAG